MKDINAARRMKQEMTVSGRSRSDATSIEAQLDAMNASDSDRSEILRFTVFLKDSASMKLPELIERHGAAYLGFTEAEVASLSSAAERNDDTP